MASVDPKPRGPLFETIIRPLQEFFHHEAAGGFLLLGATVLALAWANSPFGDAYQHLVHFPIALTLGGSTSTFSLHALINDGLMAIFFFVVGMEIKRELAIGELRTLDRALLPAIAAVGGMIAPALIYSAFNWGTPAMSGWAIPMATDIAFAIGLVTVLKDRIPWALIVFLTALAIFDDMGGIIVIALFYGSGVHVEWLAASAGLVVILFVMMRMHVRSGLAWLIMGALLWYCIHHAGIHATISGVLLGLFVPARVRLSARSVLEELHGYVAGILSKPSEENVAQEEVLQIEERLEELEPPLNRFVHFLHPYVTYLIIPVFALTNAGVDLRQTSLSTLLDPVPLGVAAGLFIGKQLGIFAFTWAAVKLKLAPSPGNAGPSLVWGVAVVGGIGFTVALFVAGLAFPDDPRLLDEAKLGILVGSALSAIAGFLILRLLTKKPAAGSVETA
ncbi:MAG: Na+/H+ antiporter NhaA [Myxococcaceae bacterium]